MRTELEIRRVEFSPHEELKNEPRKEPKRIGRNDVHPGWASPATSVVQKSFDDGQKNPACQVSFGFAARRAFISGIPRVEEAPRSGTAATAAGREGPAQAVDLCMDRGSSVAQAPRSLAFQRITMSCVNSTSELDGA